MNTNEKGYSLNVLIITIAVMVILTTTAIVTMKSLTSDRGITYFMNDIQEVENFVKQYYSEKETLPLVYNDDGTLNTLTLTEEMAIQTSENDSGKYFQVDLSKLGSIHLYDYDRGGYWVNEGSLKIYVNQPFEYNDVHYYTITSEISGVDKVYSNVDNFEVLINGNPITWVTNAKLIVSIPNQENVNTKWTFKYYKDGPINAESFKTLGRYFEYGSTIDIDENGIYSIYVENEQGFAKVVNVVVDMIDDINPYAYITNGDVIVAGDDETGIRRIMYKIQNYSIPETKRANDLIDTYTQGPRAYLPNASDEGKWTFLEAYTGEKIDGVEPSIGTDINRYKEEYEKYLTDYNLALASGDPDAAVALLDDKYPQFQYNGIPYDDDDENIVLYIEDYAGNKSVTNKNNYPCIVSRKMLLNSSFIDTIIKPLNGTKLLINGGQEYTNDREVSLTLKSQGATKMYITNEITDVPDISDYIEYNPTIDEHMLPNQTGEVTVYAYVTAEQYDGGILKFERVEAKIYVDEIYPTDTKPEVKIDYNLKVQIECKQKDEHSGIKEDENRKDIIEYGYKLSSEEKFKWVDSTDEIVLEENQLYDFKTRVSDKAGNQKESQVLTEVRAPARMYRTIANEPKMALGMKAIVWDGTLDKPGEEMVIDSTTWETKDGQKTTWYNYQIDNSGADSKQSIWANAKTSDGSYWVWIPRFAYRIIYYEGADKVKVKGYFQNSSTYGVSYFKDDGITVVTNPDEVKSQYLTVDIVFLNGTSSTQYREENIETQVTTTKNLKEEYIVHPAFQNIENNVVNNSQGKWGNNVTGIWVAKYEASRSDAEIDIEGTSTTVKVVPNVKSWTNIKINDAYEYCTKMLPSMYPSSYSHLMKNSEWGAVAYLAYSAYGRNGVASLSNKCTDYITGAGGNSAYVYLPSNFDNNYAYNSRGSKSGMLASTTGNIYGVYDLSGGAQEFVASYLNSGDNDSATIIKTNGENLTQTSIPAYKQAINAADNDAAINNYKKYGMIDKLYGSAIYETSTGYSGNYSVDSDYSKYPIGRLPFFVRGGEADSGNGAGIFAFDAVDGSASENTGFRPVIIFD